MKYFTLLIYSLLIYFSAFNQTKINSYEYWFDNNYSQKINTVISPIVTLKLIKNIPTTSLEFGIHILNIRFKDNSSKLSTTKSIYFYKSSFLITEYEYWIDGYYTDKTVKTITPSALIVFKDEINANTIVSGLHQFNIRFKDSIGNWSIASSTFFYKTNSKITAYEYWYDNNYLKKTSKTISAADSVSIIQNLSIGSLNAGYHVFNIRFNDAANNWSTTKTSYFLKIGAAGTANNIIKYRYWVDAGDTSIVNLPVATPSLNISITDSLMLGNITTGFHNIHYQFKDTAQLWSIVYTQQFRKVGKAYIDTLTPEAGSNNGYVTITS